jgi:hypothetical protein
VSQLSIREGRTIFVADAHRDDGKRFVVHADEKVTAFLELERAVCLRLLSEKIREIKVARSQSSKSNRTVKAESFRSTRR